MTPDDTRWHQMTPDDTRWHHSTHPGSVRISQSTLYHPYCYRQQMHSFHLWTCWGECDTLNLLSLCMALPWMSHWFQTAWWDEMRWDEMRWDEIEENSKCNSTTKIYRPSAINSDSKTPTKTPTKTQTTNLHHLQTPSSIACTSGVYHSWTEYQNTWHLTRADQHLPRLYCSRQVHRSHEAYVENAVKVVLRVCEYDEYDLDCVSRGLCVYVVWCMIVVVIDDDYGTVLTLTWVCGSSLLVCSRW